MSNPLFSAEDEKDPKKVQATQMAMVKLLSTPPEPILELLERLNIPWEKKTNSNGKVYLVIEWGELRKGEERNQKAGPFMATVIKKIREEVGE